MKLLLCNEVIRELEFAEQCSLAAALGYDGLELAPFTLAEEPHRLTEKDVARLRAAAEDAGIELASLHWLLVTPAGLSITSPDRAVRERTLDVMRRLVDLCAALGARVMVHGSPQQRSLAEGGSRDYGIESFAAIGSYAEKAGVTYCIEPLSHEETSFVTRIQEAVDIVEAVGSPGLKTMLDCRAAWLSEADSVEHLLERWLPSGHVKHVHLNDVNKRAPGQGTHSFVPVLAELVQQDYQGYVAIEPFEYVPDGPGCAARAIGYVKGILAGLDA